MNNSLHWLHRLILLLLAVSNIMITCNLHRTRKLLDKSMALNDACTEELEKVAAELRR